MKAHKMATITEQSNEALVLEAFDTLFNKRDYKAAERYWSANYLQHSAHIKPGRDGLFDRRQHCLTLAEGVCRHPFSSAFRLVHRPL